MARRNRNRNRFPVPPTSGGNAQNPPGSTAEPTTVGQYDQYRGTSKEPFSTFKGNNASSRWSPWKGAREVWADSRAHVWTSWPVSNGSSTGSGTPGSAGGDTTNTQTNTDGSSTDNSTTPTPTGADNGPSFAADGTLIPAGTQVNGAQNGGPPISFTGNPTDILPNPDANKNTGNPGGFTAIGAKPGTGSSSGGGGADVEVKVLDITQDIMGGTLTRKRGAATRLVITITNEDGKYEGWFIPMDRIRLWLRRGDIEYVAFTGYIAATPFYNLYKSQELTIECECLIRRFTQREWDPSYPPNILYLSSGRPQFSSPTLATNGSSTQQGNDTGTPTNTPNGGNGQNSQQAPTGAPSQNGNGTPSPTGSSPGLDFGTNIVNNPISSRGFAPPDAITSSPVISNPLLPTAASNGQDQVVNQPTKQDYLDELQGAIDNPPSGTDPQTLQGLLDTLSSTNAEEPGQGTSGDQFQQAYQQVNDILGAPSGVDPNNPAARQVIPGLDNADKGAIKGVIWPDQTLAYLLTAPQLLDIDPSLIYIQNFPKKMMDIASQIDKLNQTCITPWKELIKCQTPGANCESHGSSAASTAPNVTGGFPGCDAGQPAIASWMANAGKKAGLPSALLPTLSLAEGGLSCIDQPESNAGGPLFGLTGGSSTSYIDCSPGGGCSADDGLQNRVNSLTALKSQFDCASDDCDCIARWVAASQVDAAFQAGDPTGGYTPACESVQGMIGDSPGGATQVSGRSVNPSSNSCGTGGTTKPMGPAGVDGGSLPQSPSTPGTSPTPTTGTTPSTTNAPAGG